MIVLPSQPVRDWNAMNERYFCHIPVRNLEPSVNQAIQEKFPQWQKRYPKLTSLQHGLSQTQQSEYLAASCPLCHSLQEDFFVAELRFQKVSHG